MRKLFETKLNSRNLIKRINTWAVPLVWYLGPFLKWKREELQEWPRENKTKALKWRDKIDCVKKSRGLASIEDRVNTSIR